MRITARSLGRDGVAERLWPGGRIASHESLTQAIFRTRAALGEHAETLVTVRGAGIRFDAPVRREPLEAMPAPDSAPDPPDEQPASVPALPRERSPRLSCASVSASRRVVPARSACTSSTVSA